jgi:cell division protein ZapE
VCKYALGKHTDVARFSFNDLCGKPLGAADYYAIASTFHTVFLEDVPQLELHGINLIRRFITLVDTLYDQHVVLVVAARVPLDQLLSVGKAGDASGEKTCVFVSSVLALQFSGCI